MKTSIKHIAAKTMVAALALAAVAACSDTRDEHYEPDASNGITLWETISTQSDLSNFATVVKGCGYDRTLNGSQTFTVFAPTNDALTEAQADSLVTEYQAQKNRGVRDDDNTVVRQFLKNHIAPYTKPASSLTNDTLTLLNGKYEKLTPTAIGSSTFVTTNKLHSNGLLYTIASRISYYPNIYEYLGIDNDIDSAYAFLNSFSNYEFNESESVPGGIVDGQTVYLDSVVTLRNSMFDTFGQINNEDSTYWMLVPTNDQWTKLLDEYLPYFNYANTVSKRDSMQQTNARKAILSGTVFSRTINPDKSFQDSAVSTQANVSAVQYNNAEPYNMFYRPFDADGIFTGTKAVECSNGRVLKASDFRIKKEQTFVQTIKVECEDIQRQDTMMDVSQPLTTHTVTSDNEFYDKVSGNSYADVIAVNTSDDDNHFPQAVIQYSIPGVLSGVPYDIYIVTAPQRASDPYISEKDLLPNRILSILYYNNQNNLQQQRRLGQKVNDPTKVDTIQVASKFTFPVSSYDLTTPIVKLRLQNQVSRNQTSQYSQDMHLDCIIFKPHEE